MDDPLCGESPASVSSQAATEEWQWQRVAIQSGVFLRLPCICVHQIAALNLAFPVMTGAQTTEGAAFSCLKQRDGREQGYLCARFIPSPEISGSVCFLEIFAFQVCKV